MALGRPGLKCPLQSGLPFASAARCWCRSKLLDTACTWQLPPAGTGILSQGTCSTRKRPSPRQHWCRRQIRHGSEAAARPGQCDSGTSAGFVQIHLGGQSFCLLFLQEGKDENLKRRKPSINSKGYLKSPRHSAWTFKLQPTTSPQFADFTSIAPFHTFTSRARSDGPAVSSCAARRPHTSTAGASAFDTTRVWNAALPLTCIAEPCGADTSAASTWPSAATPP